MSCKSHSANFLLHPELPGSAVCKGSARGLVHTWSARRGEASLASWIGNRASYVVRATAITRCLSGMDEHAVPDTSLFRFDKSGARTPPLHGKRPALKRKRWPRLTKAEAITQTPGASSNTQVHARVIPKQMQRRKTSLESRPGAISRQRGQQPHHQPRRMDLWQDAADVGIDRRETKLGKLTEVILPGTSYNPDSQQHQDALALAVAVEVRQALDKELQPTPPKRHVDDAPTGADEVEQLQVQYDLDEDVDEVATEVVRPNSSLRKGNKTRADRNRQQRRREMEDAMQRREALKKQRRDVDKLQAVQAEIACEESRAAAHRLRRQVEQAEKAGAQPPRLGRRRFKAEPLQVLLSEETDRGSLRQLKPAAALARDRFKKFQRRGLVEP